jgi:dihydroneopterin aldolase
VGEDERAAPQDIVVDVELRLDLGLAGRTDDLAATVDYEAVCELVDGLVRARTFRLIEAVADAVASALLARFAVTEARVRVGKPGALKAWGVPHAAVEVCRKRGG